MLSTCIILFLIHAVPKLPTSLILFIPFTVLPPYIFTFLCAQHKGHHITPTSHARRMRDYPYDQVNFTPGKICKTCNLVKPARSKHCSLCGTCIAMCDHHCPWINNCVGLGNYGHFLALLFTLSILELYGASLAYQIMQPYLARPPNTPFFSRHYADILLYAIEKGGLSISGVGLLCASTFPLPLVLFTYDIYLVWAGMTTNESQKWADWKDDVAYDVVFKAEREALRTHNRLRKYGQHETANPALQAWDDEDGLRAAWPVKSDQVLVCTSDGEPPRGQEGLWTRVEDVRQIDNIYDLGGWENFVRLLKGS